MNENDLARAVARATGESVRSIKRLGFLLVPEPDKLEQPGVLEAQVLDWDEVYPTQRPVRATRRKRHVAATC